MNGKMNQKLFLAVLATAFIPVILAKGATAPEPEATVVVLPAVEVTEPYALKYPGKIKPVEETAIIPRVTGIIKKQYFKEGAPVKAGELLFEIEDTAYRAKVDAVKGDIIQIQAALRYAEVNFNRQKGLAETNATAQISFDSAREEYDTARGKLQAAAAELRDAENTLSYTRIYALIDGKIGKCSLTPGNLVTPSTGTLAKITMIAPIYVEFALGESIFRSQFGGMEGFARNADIHAELADHVLQPEAAEVAIIDPKVDESTNTVKIWGKFANVSGKLLPGSYVTVHLRRKNSGVIAGVMPSALQVDRNGSFVYVMKPDGTAEARYVTTGNVNGDVLEIEHGLKPGETVVVEGMNKIRPGVLLKTVPYRK